MSTEGDSATTLTVSAMLPTESCALTFAVKSVVKITLSRSTVLNPCSAKVTL